MSLTIRRLPEQDNNLLRPPTSLTPSQNGDVVLEATSNTVLTMKLKGTDGVVRNFDVGGGGSTIGTEYDIRAIADTSPAVKFRLTSSYSVLDDITFAGTANQLIFSRVNDGEINLAFPTDVTFPNDVVVTGNLTVNGTQTTVNSTTVQVDDKNLELGTVATPSDATGDGGGIILKAAADRSILWSNTNDAWTFNQHVFPDSDSTYDIGSNLIRWQNIYADAANITSITGALTGNADTATTLATARNISGVSFNGSADIDLVTDNVQESGTPTNIYFTDARARSAVSVTDSGGDGSLAYSSSTGVFTYTGPSSSEVRAHLSAGTGVGFTGGAISIGQAVGTSDSPQFVTVTAALSGNATTASTLETARNINGVSFNGSANITLDLDDIAEAASTPTNLFFTNERVDDRVSVLLTGGTGISKTYDDVSDSLTLAVDFSEFDTDNVTEGSTNQYYTSTRSRGDISVTDSGGDGALSYNSTSGVITYTGPSAAETQGHISVTDLGGDGSLSYNAGVITYTGPSSLEARAHLSGSTGVTYNSSTGAIAIGQEVATSSDVTFGEVTIGASGTRNLLIQNTDNTGTVDSACNLTFKHSGIDFTQDSIVADGNDLGHIDFRNNGGTKVAAFGFRKRNTQASKLAFEVDANDNGTPNLEVGDTNITLSSTNVDITGTGTWTGQSLALTLNDASENVGPDLILQRDSASAATNDLLGRIKFQGRNTGNAADVEFAAITSKIHFDTQGSERGLLKFTVIDAGSPVDTMTMRGSLIGLGIDEPAGQLHVKGNDTTDQIIIENTTNSSTTAPDLVLYKSGTIAVGHQPGRIDFRGRNLANDANVTYAGIFAEVTGTSNLAENGALKFYTVQGGTLSEAARITETGNYKLQADKGIDFSNQTALVGKTYEVFDHYEEGTYSATPEFVSTIRAGMTTTSTGYYTKVGRLCHVHAKVTVNITDAALIGGTLKLPIPFQPALSCSDNTICRVNMETDSTHFLNQSQAIFLDDSKDMVISHAGSQDLWVVLQILNADYQRSSVITAGNCAVGSTAVYLDFTYRTSA
tara:strand:+ start:5215 stop:8358 length:3144 start_codon:yes stop_codon:yes gene_type:complete